METMDFRKKLIDIRKQKGLTQEEVAEKCNVTARTIQRIESGTVNPRTSTIKIISKSLGFDFFISPNADYDEKSASQLIKLKNHIFLWNLKDLFNLKTYTMKRISIIVFTALIISIGGYAINSSKNKSIITKILKEDKVSNINKVSISDIIQIHHFVVPIGMHVKYEIGNNNLIVKYNCDLEPRPERIVYERKLSKEETTQLITKIKSLQVDTLKKEYINPYVSDGISIEIFFGELIETQPNEVIVKNVDLPFVDSLCCYIDDLIPNNKFKYSTFGQ